MTTKRILLVGHLPGLVAAVQGTLPGGLGPNGLQRLPNAAAALAEIERGHVALAVVAIAGPDDEDRAAALLKEIMHGPHTVPVIVITEDEDWERRLRLVSLGAVDCLARPLNVSRLAFLIDLLTVRARCQPAAQSLPPAAPSGESWHRVDGYLFVTEAHRDLYDKFSAVAGLETTVLLTGETGTGKTHAARVLHQLSPRRNKPFVVVECGGLSATLIESELFGHMRGAFTGADRDRPGKFAAAADGTILLDEIDCVPLEAQAKLLRILESKVYEPVGSHVPTPVRARVVAATNRPLNDEVAAGRFRSDLYFRLNVLDFRLPPLRDNREAIRPLAEKFLTAFCEQMRRPLAGLASAALYALETYDWPGNVRELRNAVERAVALRPQGWIEVRDLPEPVQRACTAAGVAAGVAASPQRSAGGNQLAAARGRGEVQRLRDVLARHCNNRTLAAAELGISRVALYKRLHKFGLV